MLHQQPDKMNDNDKWKEFDEFKNVAEFRGYTKAMLDGIEKTLNKVSDKLDETERKTSENEVCIATNSTKISSLQTDAKKIGGTSGGIMGVVSSVVIRLLGL